MKSYGKVKLILQNNKYYIEADSSTMKELMAMPPVQEAYQAALE